MDTNSISYHMHLNRSALARENKLRASMQLRFECEVNWILVERRLYQLPAGQDGN